MMLSARITSPSRIKGMCVEEFSLGPDDGDLVLFHQIADPAAKLLYQSVLAGGDFGVIVAQLPGDKPQRFSFFHFPIQFGAVQQRFGGDATAVEACSAQFTLFYQGNGFPKLSRADGGNISARSAAKHGNIVLTHVSDLP